ncbi:MAG: hypothetical protein HY887_00575 [Deltaproteobacteria bacterium]|nr:hypothetical protein [Deltaproteobacteria bacterium]
MDRDFPSRFKGAAKRCFSAKELQMSVAVLAVIALLAGILLQSGVALVGARYNFGSSGTAVLLIIGYVAIVAAIALVFTYRLVGPFKRLEYEMKLVLKGEFSRRLTLRTNDELHIKNFVRFVNQFLDDFEKMKGEYNKLNSLVSGRIGDVNKELSKEKFDCAALREELSAIEKRLQDFREKP